MAAYEVSTHEVTEAVERNDDLSDDAKDSIDEVLGDSETTTVEDYDPDSTVSPDADILTVRSGPGDDAPVELDADDVGNAVIIEGSGADNGLNIDLSDEDEDDAPDARVIIGSNEGDTIVGGESDLTVDTAAGHDEITTGNGDDIINSGGDDDHITIGGGGDDTINGGEGDDTVTFGGSADDWTSAANPDGSMTWTNATTGQTVTTSGVENFEFQGSEERAEPEPMDDDFSDDEFDNDDF